MRLRLILLFACAMVQMSADTIVDQKLVKELKAKTDAGDLDAMETMANWYLVGFAVPKDLRKAEQLFRTVVERTRLVVTPNDPAGLSRMGYDLRILSTLLEKRDKQAAKSMLAEAFDWLRKAALCGEPTAQVALSEAYFTGKQVPKDEVEAYAWEIVAARYLTNPSKKSEFENVVANDSQRADPVVWAKAQKLSEEFIAQIEASKK